MSGYNIQTVLPTMDLGQTETNDIYPIFPKLRSSSLYC